MLTLCENYFVVSATLLCSNYFCTKSTNKEKEREREKKRKRQYYVVGMLCIVCLAKINIAFLYSTRSKHYVFLCLYAENVRYSANN